MTDRFTQVALPLPLFEPYTYRVPDILVDRVVPGARVVVPVRKRELVGIVVSVDAPAPAMATREVLAAPDAEPALPPALLRTADWMAGYYGAPIGIALKAMIPAPMWGASRVLIRLTGAGPPGRLGGLAEQLVEWLDNRSGEAPLDTAARHFRKPLWEVADRLARVGTAELEVEPAGAEPATLVERRLELAGEPLTLIERDKRFARRISSAGSTRRWSNWAAPRRSSTSRTRSA